MSVRVYVQVAVKCSRPPEETAEAINCLREIECFSTIKHPHVLPFLGACMDDMDNCLLVTEFMPGGTLKEWLYGTVPGGRRPWRKLSDRLRKALEVRMSVWGLGRLALRRASPLHRGLCATCIWLGPCTQACHPLCRYVAIANGNRCGSNCW